MLTQFATRRREHCVSHPLFRARRAGLEAEDELPLRQLKLSQIIEGISVVVVKRWLPLFTDSDCIGALKLFSCQGVQREFVIATTEMTMNIAPNFDIQLERDCFLKKRTRSSFLSRCIRENARWTCSNS